MDDVNRSRSVTDLTSKQEDDELDRLLFEMLTREDEKSFEKSLIAYYRRALPRVIQYVGHAVRHWLLDPADVENLVEDVLSTFILSVGVDRRRIAAEVAKAARDLQPPSLNELQGRLVEKWKADTLRFHRHAINFSIAQLGANDDPRSAWRISRDEVNSQVPSLQRQGMRFLADVWLFLTDHHPVVIDSLRVQARQFLAENKVLHQALGSSDRTAKSCYSSSLRRGGCASQDIEAGVTSFAVAACFSSANRQSADLDGTACYISNVYRIALYVPDLAIRSHDYLRTSCRNALLNLLEKRKREFEEGRRKADEESATESQESTIRVNYREVIRVLLRPLRNARRKFDQASEFGRDAKRELRTLMKRREKYRQMRRVMYFWSEDRDEREIIHLCDMTRAQVRYAVAQIKLAIAETISTRSALTPRTQMETNT
jgi:hypothetical protein